MWVIDRRAKYRTALHRTDPGSVDVSEEMVAVVLEQKLKVIVCTADISQQVDAVEVFRAWRAAKTETLENMDNK